MGRKVESGTDGVLTGATLATEQVKLWAANDRPVMTEAQRILVGEVTYGSEDTTEAVRMFLEDLLYGDEGNYYSLLCGKILGGYPVDRGAVVETRNSMTRDDFDGINWGTVVAELSPKDDS